VPYVIITAAKDAKTYEKAEDPIYVLENNVPIDCKWYLTNQLSKPLTRIFEPIIDNVEKSLLQGDHTRKIFIPTPTAKKGSLMMFAQKKATCMGCKAGMNENEGNLCQYCIPKESQLYLEKLAVLKEAELRYAHLWSGKSIRCCMIQNMLSYPDSLKLFFFRGTTNPWHTPH
jgi:DNA polymerase delta subunit 1